MTGMLELQKTVLFYVDQSDINEIIEENCSLYKHVQDKAFQFTVPIDVIHLLDIDAVLGDLILNQSNNAAKIFQEVVYMYVKTLDLLPQCRNPTQIIVNLKLLSLPNIPEYQLQSSCDLVKKYKHGNFLQYRGIVCGLSTIDKYTKVARYVCENKFCAGAEGDKYIRLHIPGAREAQTVRGDFKCSICGCMLEEDITCRVLADKLLVEMVDEDAFRTTCSGRKHQSIVAYLRDDLVHGIEIGQKLSIIGLPVFDSSSSLLFVEVNSILDHFENQTASDPIHCISPSLPSVIQKLLQDRKKSPWSFSFTLAYGFAGHVAPAGTYLHFKLGLLLSLVTTVQEENGFADLLVVGSDTLIIDRLLSYAASFSPRYIKHTVTNPLMASVNKSRHGTDIPMINGGSILLANGGVCAVPHLESHKKQLKSDLLQVLENNKILVELPSRLTGISTVQQQFLPRRCTIWASLDPASKQKQLDDVQVNLNKKDITQSLADVFGIVYFVDVQVDSCADHLNSHQTMLQAMGVDTAQLLPEDEIRQYLPVARKIPTTFSEESEYLIKGYYVASRTVRSTGLHLWNPPMSAVRTIMSLAAAHAKLCLREEVTEHDALLAVLLYEECVTVRSGQSILGVKPLIHIKDNDMGSYIGQERDKQMYQFEKHLKSFITTYAPDVEMTNCMEE